jgi:hypothetical protein
MSLTTCSARGLPSAGLLFYFLFQDWSAAVMARKWSGCFVIVACYVVCGAIDY